MGLCMGFSGLSLIEVIYYFTIRVYFKRKRKRMLQRQERVRKAMDRDREKALAYLTVGRRSSITSINSMQTYPASILKDDRNFVNSDSSGYISTCPRNDDFSYSKSNGNEKYVSKC